MDLFDAHLALWGLTIDGAPIVTHSSRLLPVRRSGVPAMLKLAIDAEEKRGNLLMQWWNGEGAAQIWAREGDAVLMERAEGKVSLVDLARSGRDDEATRIICATVEKLHAPRSLPLPELVPLARWFAALAPAAANHGGILRRCADTASELLAAPREIAVLHGDVHHGNVLDFGEGGFLAIDPKGLHGERGFDYANLFCNPDPETATARGRLARRAALIAEIAGLDRQRLLQWVLAWAGLSAVWLIEDGLSPQGRLAVAELAAAELRR
jgi:streptomycin 6-kinase